MKILYLIDSLDYSGSAKQLHLLVPALAQDASVEICSLGPCTPWTDSLRQSGITVHTLDWTRWFDPNVPWRLREVLEQSAADLIHVWRLPSLRVLATVARELLPRVVMSAPLPAKGKLAWWDRWLLRHVGVLAVAGVSDQQRCLRQGLIGPRLRVVPPAAPEPVLISPSPTSSPKTCDILCIGKLEREEGFQLAIWAFDILRYVYPDIRLSLVGTGSQRSALHAMSEGLGSLDCVQFLGEQSDISALLSKADVVWIPSLANCGRQVALEAMAHGRVVIGADVPCLRDVINDGETGYLVPGGEAVPFARHTHALIQDVNLRERLGQAGHRLMVQRFSISEAVERWRDVYRDFSVPSKMSA